MSGMPCSATSLIYALAEAALVVNSDYGKGDTWAGATEQLERLEFVPVYVRADGDLGKGLAALQRLGARPWPNPKTAQELEEILDSPSAAACDAQEQRTKLSGVHEDPGPFGDDRPAEVVATAMTREPTGPAPSSPADELFAKVVELLDRMDGSRTDARVAEELQVPSKLAVAWLKRLVEMKLRKLFENPSTLKTEAELVEELRFPKHPIRSCLKRLIDEGVVEKAARSRPARYRSTASIGSLFDERD